MKELSDQLAESDKKLSDFRSHHRGELPTQMEANFQTVSVLRTENQNIDNNLIVIQDRLAALEKQMVDTPAEDSKARHVSDESESDRNTSESKNCGLQR